MKDNFFYIKIEILLRILNGLLINKPLVFNLYYNIDFACIGVDSITEVLVEPIFFIVSITFSSSYISLQLLLKVSNHHLLYGDILQS